MNDIIRSIDDGNVVALVMLNLSTAFDTVDHGTLLHILHQRFALTDTPLTWFRSNMTDRTQSISVDGVKSEPTAVTCSVPQGSVLKPLEFISYTGDVIVSFHRNRVHHHLFTDSKQVN